MDRDLVLNEYYYFVACLRIVVSTEQYQISVMGAASPGCAWELKSDIANHAKWLLRNSSSHISEEELVGVEEISNLINQLEIDQYLGMRGSEWKALKPRIVNYIHKHSENIKTMLLHLDSDVQWMTEI